jgi:hypothetical protein
MWSISWKCLFSVSSIPWATPQRKKRLEIRTKESRKPGETSFELTAAEGLSFFIGQFCI